MIERIAILGATGAVGGEFIRLIEERNFSFKSIRLLASSRSKGRKMKINGREVVVEELSHASFDGVDLVFSSASKTVSKEYVPTAKKAKAIVIDNTSCFRMNDDVPLVVPEVNAHTIESHKGIIANPNCVAAILSLPLYPLHKAFGVKRVLVSTYQAASGAGRRAVEELLEETEACLGDKKYTRSVFPHQYAFNFFIHNSNLYENGYVDEEVKIINEIKKIFDEPDFCINVTCIRVPVLRAHGLSVNLEFKKRVSVEEAYELLRNAPGVEILEDWNKNRWPMPIDASGKDPVFVGRIREDISKENTLDFWAVGDQIRKGAALNAIQIAERMKQ